MFDDVEVIPGDELSLDAAVAYEFIIGESGRAKAAPVFGGVIPQGVARWGWEE
ncbi:MAG: hypothetical protein OEN01_08875 [Candidatus Krumholzibacteria bacterium]|nr:hypothetical protein [Candidatus Krumholzibacteria bacterium]